VELWARDRRVVSQSEQYPQSFYLYLKDAHAHLDMIAGLESRFKVEETSFRTIYGVLDGYKIYASRKVAERVEKQTDLAAELYNVDTRLDQRYMAEHDLFPCGHQDESRFAPSFDVPLTIMEVRVICDPSSGRDIDMVEVCSGRRRLLEGPEVRVLSDLQDMIKVHDPDVILMPYADTWVPLIVQKARRHGLESTISRSGWFKELHSRSYWSYGRACHRDGAMIPEGRVLIDTEKSFAYMEGGLLGVLMASRLSGLSPTRTSRFTPGTLISSYEVFEAMRRGIAVPFRKRDAESTRNIQDLREADRGGMVFQPEPGVYENVHQIDFTSLYPSIIVKYNLSPETIRCPERRGFLSTILAPLLNLRIETKRLKKVDPGYSGIDSVLKWMLVTCFGYTGYKNAKFGQIEVHERITAISRELLMRIKEMAEDMGFEVLHGIVDCLWVRGEPISKYKELVETETGILTEVDSYDWIAFLPMSDGFGAYNRYFGKLTTGKMKVRGVMARKGDTPEYVRQMQEALFEVLSRARDIRGAMPEMRDIYQRYLFELSDADPRSLAIHRRAGRLSYSKRCAEASAVQAYRKAGVSLSPGMNIGYVIRDADKMAVDIEANASEFDVGYYGRLLEKAWGEVAFVFKSAR